MCLTEAASCGRTDRFSHSVLQTCFNLREAVLYALRWLSEVVVQTTTDCHLRVTESCCLRASCQPMSARLAQTCIQARDIVAPTWIVCQSSWSFLVDMVWYHAHSYDTFERLRIGSCCRCWAGACRYNQKKSHRPSNQSN